MSATATQTQARDFADDVLLAAARQLSPERLRLLRAIFSRAAELLAERLREMADAPFSVELEEVHTAPVEEAGLREEGAMPVLCTLDRLEQPACLCLNAGAVDLAIEALLGGGARDRSAPGKREYTDFDRLFAGMLAEAVAETTSGVMMSAHGHALLIGEVGREDAAEVMEGAGSVHLLARFRLSALGQEGVCALLLPHSAVTTLRVCAGAEPAQASVPPDEEWLRAMQDQLQAAEIVCEATLSGAEITLAEVAALKPGQVLPLNEVAGAPVTLRCDGVPLFHCELGQQAGVFTLRLRKTADEHAEFIESLRNG